MRLTLFGASGGVGSLLLDQALTAGHEVTAVVRRPEALRGRVGCTPSLTVLTVDLRQVEPTVVAAAVRGSDAVLSAVGASGRRDAPVAAPATSAIVAAMNAERVRRLVAISASPVLALNSPGPRSRRDSGEDPLTRWVLGPPLRRVFADVYADLAAMEDLLRSSGLDWTAIRPPRLTDGPARPYRVAVDRNLPHGRRIARTDVAAEMLAVLDRPQTTGHTVGIAY